jgi:UDP-2,4-diacetamido-2,4,6-trideoxy-beta-L-altropyranose hydrolase
VALTIRTATDADRRLLWDWANDPGVRAVSFQREPIPWADHVAWFETHSRDPNCFLYIVENNSQPVGQVRFEVSTTSAEVHISLVSAARGRGYGGEALRLGCADLRRLAGVTRIIAHVQRSNTASIRAFEKAGFVQKGLARIRGHDAVRFVLD